MSIIISVMFLCVALFIACVLLIVYLLFGDIFPDSWLIKPTEAISNVDNSIHININNNTKLKQGKKFNFEICEYCGKRKMINAKCNGCGA